MPTSVVREASVDVVALRAGGVRRRRRVRTGHESMASAVRRGNGSRTRTSGLPATRKCRRQAAGGRGSNRSAGRRPATTTVVIGASWRAHGTAAGAALTDGDGHERTSGAPRALRRRRRRRRRCWSHAGRSARERDTVATHAVQSVR